MHDELWRQGDHQRRLFWAYAAAFGAAWGSLEIVVGSFLHSLHMPLTGPLLASVGAALLVAERQLLSRRGLCLATGVVAAACKSLSPAGVILGPMIGIVVESALVELALFGASRNPVSAGLAGALAALFAAGEKILVQVVLYGGDIVSLYLAAIRRGTAWLGATESFGWSVVGGVIGTLAAVGASGGVLGLRAGRQCQRLLARGDVP